MNKLYLYIYTFIVCPMMLCACFDDKGSYDYHDINEITISGLQNKYQVYADVSTLKIEPEITTTEGDRNLIYEWRAVQGYSSSTLIGTERNLDYHVQLEPNNYTLYLRVTDGETGVTSIKTAALEVGTPYMKGIMIVGQDAQNKTKLQMLSVGTDTTLIADVLKDSSLPELAEGVDIIHTGKGSYPKLWLITKEQCFSLNMKRMTGDSEQVFEKQLFLTENYSGTFNPVDFVPRIKDQSGNTGSWNSGNSAVVCSNGYVFNSTFSFLGGAYYTDPVNHPSGDFSTWFKAKPYLLYSLKNWNGFVYYDETNERFLKVGAYNDYSAVMADNAGDPFPWNQAGTNRTMVYGENTFNTDGGSGNGNSFVIMKDKTDNSFYIYKFYAVASPVKRDFYSVKPVATDFDKADFYAFSSLRTLVYYAVGNKLYAYDYNKNNEKLYLIKDFGNETITMVKCDTQIEPSDNPLYIATYSADKGGVLQKYAQDLTPDNVSLKADEKCCWEGLVKIKSISWRATN